MVLTLFAVGQGFAEKTAPFIQSHFRVKVEVNTHEAGKLFVEISGDSTTDQLHGVAHLFRYAVRRCREGLKVREEIRQRGAYPS